MTAWQRALDTAVHAAFGGVVIVAAVCGCGDTAPTPRPRSASQAQPPPAAKADAPTNAASATGADDHAASTASAPAQDPLVDIDGPGLLAQIRARGHKATLVNTWASWCGSCKQELPMLIDLAAALRAEGIDLIFISVDEPSAREAATQAIGQTKAEKPWFIVHGAIGPFIAAVNPKWKGAIPSTFLFDRDAALRYFWPGPIYEHEISPVVEAFLAGQPLPAQSLAEHGPPG